LLVSNFAALIHLGSIDSYVVIQPGSKLLQSKDGLKQGKLDIFLKPKFQCNQNRKSELSGWGCCAQNVYRCLSNI